MNFYIVGTKLLKKKKSTVLFYVSHLDCFEVNSTNDNILSFNIYVLIFKGKNSFQKHKFSNILKLKLK